MTKTEREELARRVQSYRKLNTVRYYMATFDLKGAKGREALYNKFRSHLNAFMEAGNTHKFIKQCYFVRCRFAQKDVRTEMQALLSARDSILVTRLGPGASFSLRARGAAPAARQFFADLRDAEGEL